MNQMLFKKAVLLVCFFNALLFNAFASNMPEPYRSIKNLPFDNHGWFGNARQLQPFLARKPEIIIEIGSWLGASTRYLASNQAENGVVYAVDTWLGSPLEAVHQQDPRLPYLYQLFLSNVKRAGLTHKIIPIRMSSMEAAGALNVQADLIYLDGAHDTASVLKDIQNWYPHLKPGGVMCGDDWLWDTVRVAVVQKGNELNKIVHSDGNFWWYE